LRNEAQTEVAHVARDGAESQRTPLPTKRVAIIGAGAAGVVAAKVLLEAGIGVAVYEAGSYVGGLWVYDNDNGASIAYRNLYILTPKRYTQWRDFPMDAATPEYARHSDMARYFQQYADFFDVAAHIRFNTRVIRVDPLDGRWRVASEGGGAELFDAVVVATGHFHRPRWPPVLEHFTGEVLHSSQYREPAQATNKRVLVIGLGNSGCDVAADISWSAAKTVISARTPVFNGPRWLFGRSFLDVLSPLQGPRIPQIIPARLSKLLVRLYWGDLSRWGFRDPPKGAHGVLHEFLFPILKYGRLSIKPDIDSIDEQKVTFRDGTTEEFDLVIAATGYELSFPFLHDLIQLNEQHSEVDHIYLRIVAVDRPGLYFVGLSNANGTANTPTFERQAEFIADVLTERVRLPTDPEMRAAVRERRARTSELYLNTPRHAMEEPHPAYVIELVRERRNRAVTHGSLPSDGASRPKRYGRCCWLCGCQVPVDEARAGHATDWGALRRRPNEFTKAVRLCEGCFLKSRGAHRRVMVGAAITVFVLVLVVSGLVGVLLLLSGIL
jgi:dimethylaniline monooxygenase (N-oxide forming)